MTSSVRRAKVDDKEQVPRAETISLRQKHMPKSCKLFFGEDPLKIVRAKGAYMYDEQGHEYLDCINNVAHVGHCHPHVVEMGQRQMAILNTNNRFLHDNIVLYAERLTSHFPSQLSVVFFVNSGSEANDLALRLSAAYTGSKEVITVDHAYHGHVTSLIDISPYKFAVAGGSGCPEHTHVVPVADVYRGKYRDCDYPGEDLGVKYADEIKAVCDKLASKGQKPSCFIAESLQSCGGQIIYPPGYLRHVYSHVRKAGGVCIADEVQVGFGRVGTSWWAFQTQGSDIVPDIVTVGKPMGNGHPVAAVITTQAIADSFGISGMSYFNTFGGNPVSGAIANAVLDVIEDEKLLDHAKELGDYLKKSLEGLKEKHKLIGDLRAWGMFFGLDMVTDRTSRSPATAEAARVVDLMRRRHILLQTDGPHENVVKFKSPLAFTKKDADRLLSNLDAVLREVEAGK